MGGVNLSLISGVVLLVWKPPTADYQDQVCSVIQKLEDVLSEEGAIEEDSF